MLDLQDEVDRAFQTLVAQVLRRARGEVVRILGQELAERRARNAVTAATSALRRIQKERSSRPAGRPWGTGVPKRTATELRALARRFTAFVEANPGLRMEEINERLRIETKALRLPVARLVAAGVIWTKGRMRARRYFVADAEREPIVARAGEPVIEIDRLEHPTKHMAAHSEHASGSSGQRVAAA